MQENFSIKEICNTDLISEIRKIGFDENYAPFAVDKFEYKTFKIYSLNCAQANILKQTALSVGADCATHRDVICGKIDYSDVILGGSLAQIKKIAQKLELQPFNLKSLGETLLKQVENKPVPKTKIVGILNITPDSFSDGGLYLDKKTAEEKFISLITDGADMIDIGAESTRPYSEPVDAKTQLERLLPIVEFSINYDIPISIDTRSSKVADEILKIRKCTINDVSGLEYDNKMAEIVAKYNAPVIIQHSKGTPLDMQNNPQYKNLTDEIHHSLKEKIKFAENFGINNIILDVGIGFGKTQNDNIELIKRIGEFKSLCYPLMLGISRKSFLNVTADNNELKDTLSLAFGAIAITQNTDYLRVHNVKLHKKFLDLYN